MKTITLDIIKKNRVYFKCKQENGYIVKLRVTPASENLALGKQDLLVRDVSIRTKYGVDVIYDLESEIKPDDGIVTLQHRYNELLVKSCKELGGRWDAESKTWVFAKIVEDHVEELDELYNSEQVNVEIMALEDLGRGRGAVEFCGYILARAQGKNSGAHLGEHVSMLSGGIYSAGSTKNWSTRVEFNSVFRLTLSRKLLEKWRLVESERFAITILEQGE